MIVKNEEKYLTDALTSVHKIAGEIIVVDTGSTDRTPDIARSFGAQVIPYIWQNNFSAARNVTLAHATQDWILFLDADEVIAPADARMLLHCCQSQVPVVGYMLIQRNYTTDRRRLGFVPCTGSYPEELSAPGFVPVERIGLFRNDPRIRFSGIIHETVAPSIRAIDGVVSKTDIAVHHYGHLDIPARSTKTNYYLELGKQQIEQTPDDPKPYYDVGIIYLNRGDLISAEHYLMKSYQLDATYRDITLNLALLYFKWHKFDTALIYAEQAYATGSNAQTIVLLKGLIYEMSGRTDRAAEEFARGVSSFPENPVFYEYLGFISLKTGNLSVAESAFAGLLDHAPFDRMGCIGLVEVYYRAGHIDRAVNLILAREASGLYDQQLTVWKLILYVRTGNIQELPAGIEYLQKNGYTGGEIDYFKAVIAESRGQMQSAVKLFGQALKKCPYLADEIRSRVSALSLR